MAKNNSFCTICGKGYHKCLSCADKMAASPWKRHTDTSEHYKVYQILHGYSTGVFNKDEAKARFKSVDLSDLNTFRDHVKATIEEILKEEAPAKEERKPWRRAVEKPVEAEPVEEQEDEQENSEEE